MMNAARRHASRTAIVEATHSHSHHHQQTSYTYADLLRKSSVAKANLQRLGVKKGDRVCVFGEKTADYTAIHWGLWRLGAAPVTLLPSYPAKELEYYVMDADAKLVVASDSHKAEEIVTCTPGHHLKNKVKIQTPKQLLNSTNPSDFTDSADHDVHVSSADMACLVYTSGSTSHPKGVVTTHGAMHAMIDGMVKAWEWTENDHILHFLPLHHIHGFVNKLWTPLSVGAKVEFVDFEPEQCLRRLNSDDETQHPTVFMGVPTIYAKLVERWEKDGQPDLEHLAKLRLFVCGSAPLPVQLFDKFQRIAKEPILERWGMTELGMGLGNPIRPLENRHAGHVGLPFPGIEVKIADLDADPEGKVLLGADKQGDLLVRGESVFKTYWGKAAKLTAAEFTKDGFFKTGDVALFDSALNSYKIVGRKSVDIIKSGGYKISALEVERAILECPDVDEVAVLGIPDDVWGEAVVAIVVPKKNSGVKVDEQFIKEFTAKHLVKYKIPRHVLVMDAIPKNAMGKFNKKTLKHLFSKA